MESTTATTRGDAAGETTDRRPSRGRRTALAVVAAVGVAAVVRVLALVLVGDAPGFRPLAPGMLVGGAAAAALGAAGVYGVVCWLSPAPDRTFRRLAAAAVIVGLVPLVTVLPGVRGATPVGLLLVALAGVGVAVAVVAALTGWRAAPERADEADPGAATRWRR